MNLNTWTNPKYNMVYDVAFFYFYIAMCYLNPEKQYNRRNTSPQKLTHQIYLFKVNNRIPERGLKYVMR